jgi:hypothetical protein
LAKVLEDPAVTPPPPPLDNFTKMELIALVRQLLGGLQAAVGGDQGGGLAAGQVAVAG